MRFRAEVKVTLKRGVLDPQGSAVQGGLQAMGYTAVEEVRIGKLVECWLEAGNEAAARAQVEEVSRRLLANPVLEEFSVTVQAEPAPVTGRKGVQG